MKQGLKNWVNYRNSASLVICEESADLRCMLVSVMGSLLEWKCTCSSAFIVVKSS